MIGPNWTNIPSRISLVISILIDQPPVAIVEHAIPRLSQQFADKARRQGWWSAFAAFTTAFSVACQAAAQLLH